ncbi:MAG: glycosyltransferase family 2 protein [Acidimicrobiales bacterium]
MSSPLVSVCIPAYGRPHELYEALLSVLTQDFEDFEVVVGDDSGELKEVVFSIGDSRIRYLGNPIRLGMAGNWSSTLDNARGRYRALLMDDDVLLPGFLSATVQALEADSSVGIAFTDHYLDIAGVQQQRGCSLTGGRYEDGVGMILHHQPVAVSAALMRFEVWDQVRPLPDLLNADLVMHLRAADAGWAFFYIDAPLMAYRVHAGQLTSQEARFRGDLVRAWELFEFRDVEHEALRQRFLASALIARAATHLKAGEGEQARATAARARTLVPRPSLREALVVALARNPSISPPVLRAWGMIHRMRQRRPFDELRSFGRLSSVLRRLLASNAPSSDRGTARGGK